MESSISADEAQQTWERLIDDVARMDSREPLAAQYVAEDYLPGRRALSPTLVRALQEADADYASAAKDLYQLRVTRHESFHATPIPPSFALLKSGSSAVTAQAVAEQSDSVADADAALQEALQSGSGKKLRQAAEQDGRDFYSRYLLMTAARKAESSEELSPSSPQQQQQQLARAAGSSAPLPSTLAMRDLGRLNRTTNLTQGFMDSAAHARAHRAPDFMPIILIPSTVTSPLQLVNIRTFLTEGMYVDPPTLFVDAQTGATNVQDTKPDSVIVSPENFTDGGDHQVAFRAFRVMDDPAKVDDWSHVCACIVNGRRWELERWFPGEDDARATEPSYLFTRLCGFLPYFEEDKVPPAVSEWHVHPLLLTRRATKTQQHIKEAFRFWELLYAFLDQHPNFKRYDVMPDE